MVDTQDLDPTFAAKVDQLIAASQGKIYLTSGYRSDALQAQLYQQAVEKYGATQAGNWVAPPGKSNHNRGLAVDLGGDIDLAHRLAPQFGLVFPMSWEPWHLEPVGARATSPAEAYTTGPVGTTNPTEDPTLDGTPAFLAAALSDSLTQQGLSDQTATTETGSTGSGGKTTADYTPTGTPTAGGGDKRLPGYSLETWARDVLAELGAPITDANLTAMEHWANTESGGYNPNAAGGKYNPLNTTEGAVGYVGEGGSQGDIKDFGSYQKASRQSFTI